MIAGSPRVVDGEVRDEDGDRVICRVRGGKPERRIYHRVAVECYEDEGAIRPACSTRFHDTDRWLARREADLAVTWSPCKRQACFGDYSVAARCHDEDSTLAERLKAMSVEEFDDTTKTQTEVQQ